MHTRPSPSTPEPLEARIAPAGVFKWNVNASANWNVAGNWLLVSGDAGAGFPNGVDDVAQFTNIITADRIVTIPNGVTITVGELQFDDNNAYTIAAAGTGRLVIESTKAAEFLGTQGAITITNANGDGAHLITAPVEMHSNVQISVTSAAGFTMSGVISDDGQFRLVEKMGTGQLTFGGTSANTYGGSTWVKDGTLTLSKPAGVPAASGSYFSIGDGSGSAGSAKVVLATNGQIAANSFMQISSDGLLDLANHTQTLSGVELFGGVSSAGAITTGAAGSLNTASITARLLKGAGVPSISGVVNFGGSTGVIEVEDGDPNTDLVISAVLAGSAGFRKTGAGVLELNTAIAQAYTGTTAIDDGVLLLNTTTTDAGISNDITINSGGTLRLVNNFEVPDSATVTVFGGKIEVLSGVEDWSTLSFFGGKMSIAPGGTFRLRPGGTVTVNGGAYDGVTIHGGGAFSLASAAHNFAVGDTQADDDLLMDVRITELAGGYGIAKTGLGRMVIARDATYTGTTSIGVGGVLELRDAKLAGPVNFVGGGLLTGSGSVRGLTSSGGGTFDPTFRIDSTLGLALGATDTFTTRTTSPAMNVTGTVNLGGAKLDWLGLGIPFNGNAFIILGNDGNDAITGTFAGLPEGAKLVTPAGNFFISYVGGDGNDVTLTPELLAPTITGGGKVATFTDYDGDLVTVKTTKGTFTSANFILPAAGAGARFGSLNLTTGGFDGAKITITAKPQAGAGDKHVDLGSLNAFGVDLLGFSIPGDLGQITVGNGASNPKLGLGSLVADSLGLNYNPALPYSFYPSTITGPLGSMKIKGDVRGYSLTVNSGGEKSGSIFIGGSFTASSLGGAGTITINGSLGSLTVLGDVNGGSVFSEKSLKAVTIGGSLIGKTGMSLYAETLGAITIKGDLRGAGSGRVTIGASGNGAPADAKQAVAIGSLTIGGKALNADVLAGYAQIGITNPINADVVIGKIAVKGNWENSRALTGVASANSIFGDAADGPVGGGGNANIHSRIASIIIGGAVKGTSAGGDASGFVAQDIGSLIIGGAKLPLNPARFTDNLVLGIFADVFVREIPAT